MSVIVPAIGRIIRWVILCVACIAGCGVASILGCIGIVYAHFQGDARLPANCGLVFGAAVFASDEPGPAIVRRVSTAARLYREHQVQRLILSGGRGEGNSASEAQVMQKQALAMGVHPTDIVLEDQSHSTWENLLYSRNLTSSCKSVVGISDAYHLARIELLAQRQGWTGLMTYPADIRPQSGSENRSVLREAVAYMYYALHIDQLVSTQTIEQHAPFMSDGHISDIEWSPENALESIHDYV